MDKVRFLMSDTSADVTAACRDALADPTTVEPHPLFRIVPGPPEPWERR